ncbi:MAG: chromosomal replication initiator protein DnaA [Bacillota bacterium]
MENVWLKTLDLIKMDIGSARFDRWFCSVENITLRNGTVYITVPDEYAQEYMQQSFYKSIKKNLKLVSNQNLDVYFVTNDEIIPEEENNTNNKTPKNNILEFSEVAGNGFQFNPRYTFDSFVVGNSNRFAHAAAMAVADRPSRTYNPLFIYGGSGLGKTHLMHAIAQKILIQNKQTNVVYISTESFTNEFISMIRTGKAHAFKNRYRNADVFLIDDIQFLAGKKETQEEFFHTFNALHDLEKQIIITSDRPPKEIEMLEERLRSRFEWGLITDIQPPDVETRCAILQRKALSENAHLSDEVIFLIADKIHSNIRELEGALNKVMHFALLNNIVDIEVSHVLEALKEILPKESQQKPTIELIQKIVADHFDLRINDMKSKKRDRAISYPRQIAMYLCRDILDISFPKIGHDFGGRDHSTVIHACEKIDQLLNYDLQLEKTIKQLTAQITK